MKRLFLAATILAVTTLATNAQQATAYAFEPSFCSANFAVDYLGLSRVTGTFTEFGGEVRSKNKDFTDAYISFYMNATSITTHNNLRDNHLKSAEFLSASKHPSINFTSTHFTKMSGNNYKLKGMLEIRGVKKEVELDAVYGGKVNYKGQWIYGFTITGKINRRDFGMNYNEKMKDGNQVVSDMISIFCNIQLIKQG
jgi:polyisoprenoid-binding protein YceI